MATARQLLTRIDDLVRGEHYFLRPEDVCYYSGDYTSGRGFSHSPTNNQINNLKKPVDRKDKPEWRHKEQAIQDAVRMFRTAIPAASLDRSTLIPVPTSKHKSDPLHDDWLSRMVQSIGVGTEADVCELIEQTASYTPSHLSGAGDRKRPEDLEAIYRVVPRPKLPLQRILVFDDVLVTGAHFVAVKSVLQKHFPNADVIGLFIARRVLEKPEPESFPDLTA